jgi:hypothetical protein
VKSSAGPKDYHFDDIALQLYVLKGAGIVVSSAEHADVDTAYVRGPVGPRAHSILSSAPIARGRFAPHAVEAALRPSAACAAARRAIGIRNGEHET